MRTRLAITFILLYGVALMRPALPLVEYYVKWDQYQANCINKAKPELQCNGQCILMQKIKASTGEQNSPIAPPAPVKINFEDYPIGIIEHLESGHGNLWKLRSLPSDKNEALSHQQSVCEIFHPPSV